MKKQVRILVVDDDTTVVKFLQDCLALKGYEVAATSDPLKAGYLFTQFSPDLCLLDFHMPGKTGADLLVDFKKIDPTVEVVFLTAMNETRRAIELMKQGAVDFLLKPVDILLMNTALARALEHRQLVQENSAYRMHLENMVTQKTADLNDALRNLAHLHSATLHALGLAMDFRDQSTGGHCMRVAECTLGIARHIGIPESELIHIEQGAFLHDIGKLKIPDAILLKPSKLTDSEWTVMQRHAEYGKEFLSNIDFLQPATDVVYSHHERFDGKGYPRGLGGTEIPIGARIFAIVDTIDALCYKRPYNTPVPFQAAAAEVLRCAGTQFDPALVAPALDYLGTRFGEIELRRGA